MVNCSKSPRNQIGRRGALRHLGGRRSGMACSRESLLVRGGREPRRGTDADENRPSGPGGQPQLSRQAVQTIVDRVDGKGPRGRPRRPSRACAVRRATPPRRWTAPPSGDGRPGRTAFHAYRLPDRPQGRHVPSQYGRVARPAGTRRLHVRQGLSLTGPSSTSSRRCRRATNVPVVSDRSRPDRHGHLLRRQFPGGLAAARGPGCRAGRVAQRHSGGDVADGPRHQSPLLTSSLLDAPGRLPGVRYHWPGDR